MKGISVVAARRLVDALSGAGITTFIAHDFDKAGLTIAHTIGTDSRRYTFTNTPLVVDVGLRLDDVLRLGLEEKAEPVKYGTDKDPRENLAESGATEDEQAFLVSGGGPGRWVGRRVELNALTSDQLVAFLEGKLRQHGVGKVVPDRETLDAAYRRAVLPRGRTSPPSPTAISSIRTRATTPPARP